MITLKIIHITIFKLLKGMNIHGINEPDRNNAY